MQKCQRLGLKTISCSTLLTCKLTGLNGLCPQRLNALCVLCIKIVFIHVVVHDNHPYDFLLPSVFFFVFFGFLLLCIMLHYRYITNIS